LEQQLERLTEAYMGGVIRLEEYARRRRELEEKTEAFESQERELGQQTDRRAELSGMVSRVEDYRRRVSEAVAGASFEQKRRLVELLVARVIVTEADVEIRYVIPTRESAEHTRFCHLRTNYLLSLSTFLSRCRGDDAGTWTSCRSFDCVQMSPELCPGDQQENPSTSEDERRILSC
jgi:hypothetical protein